MNMVAGTRLTNSIDLYAVSAELDVDYEAEQFPGMVYRISPATHGPTAPTLCLLLFKFLNEFWFGLLRNCNYLRF